MNTEKRKREGDGLKRAIGEEEEEKKEMGNRGRQPEGMKRKRERGWDEESQREEAEKRKEIWMKRATGEEDEEKKEMG